MIMRLFDRDLRADSSTGAAWPPTRITQASNFSLARRSAFSEVIGTLSMPNCRKHSVSRLREDSCKSTSAARAENFREGGTVAKEFPKAFSVVRVVLVGHSCPTPLVLMWGGRLARQSSPGTQGEVAVLFRPRPPKPYSGAGIRPQQPRIRTMRGTKVLLPKVTRSALGVTGREGPTPS